MTPHVPRGFPAVRRTFSNALGSALHRTYASTAKQPTGNAATPCHSLGDLAQMSSGRSSKHPVEEPAMGCSSLTVNPQPHAMNIESRVVIACDVTTIPPAGLDALGLAEQS